MKIVVDAMGGDYAPQAVVAGVVEALKEFSPSLALIGIKEQVEAELKKYNYPQSLVEVIHAPEVIDMHEPATVSIRKKRNSSITLGVELLKKEGYSAFVSAGNTGAVVCASSVNLGLIPGVERPGIGVLIPTLNGCAMLLDAGANTDPKPEHLLRYAQMAKVYAREVTGVAQPKVGLLNIGAEECKGTDFEKETHKLLQEKFKDFYGNIEANEIYSGKCDCIVCDGYVGNIVLKVSEGLMESVGTLVKKEVKKDPMAMLGALMMKWRLKEVKKQVDYAEYGGAPLLGVDGIVMISHGRSNPKAIKNAIKAAQQEIEHNIIAKIKEEITTTA